MGILHDDVVIIRPPEKEGESTIITVNCPDKTGLGCDLCRIILFFGLSILRGGKIKIKPIPKYSYSFICFCCFCEIDWFSVLFYTMKTCQPMGNGVT